LRGRSWSAKGVAAIWQLHLAAARAYRDGQKAAATGIIEIADVAERGLRGMGARDRLAFSGRT